VYNTFEELLLLFLFMILGLMLYLIGYISALEKYHVGFYKRCKDGKHRKCK